jgi:hypothetical protein
MRRIIILCGLVLALAPVAQAARANVESQTAQDLAVVTQTVTHVRTETVKSIAVANCYVEVHKTTGENAFNVDLWWIKQRVAWCGRKITQNQHTAWVIASGPWYTPKCKGRSYGITAAGFWWEWLGWKACRAKGHHRRQQALPLRERQVPLLPRLDRMHPVQRAVRLGQSLGQRRQGGRRRYRLSTFAKVVWIIVAAALVVGFLILFGIAW